MFCDNLPVTCPKLHFYTLSTKLRQHSATAIQQLCCNVVIQNCSPGSGRSEKGIDSTHGQPIRRRSSSRFETPRSSVRSRWHLRKCSCKSNADEKHCLKLDSLLFNTLEVRAISLLTSRFHSIQQPLNPKPLIQLPKLSSVSAKSSRATQSSTLSSMPPRSAAKTNPRSCWSSRSTPVERTRAEPSRTF